MPARPAVTSEDALKAEQERMLSLLSGLQATLAAPSPAATNPEKKQPSSLPTPTPTEAARNALAHAVTRHSPPMLRPATSPTATTDHSLIELSGELQETRGALEAERMVNQKLTRQLAELTTRMSQVAHERGNEKSDSKRAAEAQRTAEDEAAAARGTRDDALRRLNAVQQSLASERQTSEYAIAEARALHDAAVTSAHQERSQALSEAQEARAARQSSEAEAHALRNELLSVRDELHRVRAALTESETARRQLANSSPTRLASQQQPPTSHAATAAVLRASELEATVAELRAQLRSQQQQQAAPPPSKAMHPPSALLRGSDGVLRPRNAANTPEAAAALALRDRTTALELQDAAERVANAEHRARHAEEQATAEAQRHSATLYELEQLRAQVATSEGRMREYADAQNAQAPLRTRLDEAERRVREYADQVSALEAERRAWRNEMAADKKRSQELEGAAERFAKDKSQLEARIYDLKQNAERRAAEALAVREMHRDAAIAAASRPSVELLRENDKLRKELYESRFEGERRAQETVAAMAANVEDAKAEAGGGAWGWLRF